MTQPICYRYADVDPSLDSFKRPCNHNGKTLKCMEVTLEYIKRNREHFYEVPDKVTQDKKLCNYMSVFTPSRRRGRDPIEEGSGKPKNVSVYYFFPCGTTTPQVCRQFLMLALSISKSRLNTVAKVISKGDTPKEHRGGDRVSKKNESRKEKVREFLNRFPANESHFNRKISKSISLPPELSLKKLHNLYNSGCNESYRVTISMFRRVFYSEYNIGFSSSASDV